MLESFKTRDPAALLWNKYFVPETINKQRLPYMDTPLIYDARLNNLKIAKLHTERKRQIKISLDILLFTI